MELQYGHSSSSGSRGTSISSSTRFLPTTMPWEWTLEFLLDLQKVSLSYLREVVAFIPQINEPRCSRLIQKVALRFLDEVIVTRKVDAWDVPLIRFILKEQGVSDVDRIHSLEESFENDLILRVETEAVLTNLRCAEKVGRKNWEDFENTLDFFFPEDSCGPRGIERRKELITVIPDRLRDEPQKDFCDQVLGKYSLEELLRDIEQFIENKRKFFKIKFLDQLAADVDNGVYSLTSTLPELQISPRVHQNFKGIGDSQVPDVLISGWERLRHKPKHSSSRVEDFEVPPGIVDDTTDPTLDLNQAAYLPSSNSAPRKVDKQASKDKDENCDVRKRFIRANVPPHENLRAEMSCRMSEVDEVAKGITKEINELVNDITKFAEDVNKAACIRECIPCFGNQQNSNLDPTIGRDPFWMQQNSEAVLLAQRFEVDTDLSKVVEEHIETRKPVDLPTSDFVERCKVGDTMARQEMEDNCVDKVMKRNANEVVDQFTGVAKKVKYDDADETKGHKKQAKQSNAADKIGFQFSPIITENDEDGPSKSRLNRETEDTAAAENVHDQTGRTSRTRIYLGRMSKDGRMNSSRVNVTSAEVPVAESGDGDLNAKCCLCGRSGGCQAFCHRCPVSVHECCLLKFYMAQASVNNSWYCFCCAAKMAQEGVKKAKEDVTKAKEALMKAEEEALKTQKILAAFSSATGEWSQVHYQSQNGMAEHNGRVHFGNSLQRRKRSLKAMLAEQSSTDDSSSEPEREKNISSKIERIMEAAVRNSGLPLKRATDPDAARPASPRGEGTKMQTAVQASIRDEVLDAAKSDSVADLMFSREAVNRPAPVFDRPATVPSLYVIHSIPLREEKRFGTGGKEKMCGAENQTQWQPPLTSSASQSCTRSGVHEGTNEDLVAANVASRGSEVSLSPGGNASLANDSQINIGNPEGKAGHEHVATNVPTSGSEVPLSLGGDANLANDSQPNIGNPGGEGDGHLATNVPTSGSQVPLSPGGDANLANDSQFNMGNPGGEEGDGHDGDLEEVYEGNKADTDGGKVADAVDEEVSEDTSTEPKFDVRPRGRQVYKKGERRQIPGIRRRNLPWTNLEETVLKKGVKMFSNGGEWGFQWKRVLEFGDGKFHGSRTAVDLKDKWRNMMKAGSILSDGSS